MKFLVFGDMHGDLDAYEHMLEKLKEEPVDLIVCLGDFTIFGIEMEELLEKINSMGQKVIMIHGNHEHEDELVKALDNFENIEWFHKKVYTHGDYHFIGYGGGGFTKHDKDFVDFASGITQQENLIFITHQPPFDTTLDEVSPGNHTGNEDFTNYIKGMKPIIAASGHIHETFGFQDVIGETLLINPGPLGQIIELDDTEQDETENTQSDE